MDLTKINYSQFYRKYLDFKVKIKDNEHRCLCPFHNDTSKPNFDVNLTKGVWYCYVCQEGGNVVDFYKKHTGKTARDFAIEYGILHVEDTYTDKCHKALLGGHSDIKKYLSDKRGLDESDITLMKLGYDEKAERITIPIKDRYGVTLNMRKYKPDADIKMMSYKKGYGSARLFPIYPNDITKKDKFVLCEGEWDCMLLNKMGLPAMTVTGGAGHWKSNWTEDFNIKDKEIYIIFDCDEPGRKGAKRIADILSEHNKVKIIDMKLKNKEDITDFFITYKKSPKELFSIIIDTDFYISSEVNEDYHETTLNEASKHGYYNSKIMFKGIVVGKDLSPYQIPHKLEIECKSSGSKEYCNFCGLSNGYSEVEINNREDILECTGVNKQQLLGTVRKVAGIYRKCQGAIIVKEAKRNVEDIKIIPEIDFADNLEDSEYVVRKAFYLGNKIKANQTYLLYGTTLPDPKNQQVVHVIDKAIPIKDNIEEFKLDDDTKKRLSIFKLNGKSIKERLGAIYKDFTYNVTNIYQREDLLTAYDLVYHSVLSFDFLGHREKKGWCEVFVVGDSRTGKSNTIKELIRHYKAGERVTAEGSSFAGLVAGLQQTQNKWTLMWGKIPLNDKKIPLNDKRIITIDESHSMKREEWGELSDIRSSGIAEINKVQQQKTTARTRKIFIANPPSKRLVEYNYGVMSMKEIIGQNEDISRFDFALAVADTDVPDKEINKDYHGVEVPHVYTERACHELVMFAWSRKPENIKFENDAVQRILEVSNEFAKTFSKAIPLVQGAEIRVKIARLSVALATRLYNVDKTGENVIVTKDFVDYIRQYLMHIYSKDGFDYLEYSIQRKKEATLEDKEFIRNLVNEDTVTVLIDSPQFSISDLCDILDKDRSEVRGIVSKLMRIGAIRKRYSLYRQTPALIVYLKKIRDEYKKIRHEEVGTLGSNIEQGGISDEELNDVSEVFDGETN
jgi:5S rRNA maturation endonuclease (ribonuclease M5)/predicted transcriptional regulator